jgi:two-component system sensor histidine kinase and response regulator WspE
MTDDTEAPPDTRRILLVDDSPMTLDVATARLEMSGFVVRSASNVEDFMQVLVRWRPHLIVADVNMPGMSGPDLCRKLQAELPALVPVVLFSSLPVDEIRALAESSGAHGYVSKRQGLDVLTQQLEELCESILW